MSDTNRRTFIKEGSLGLARIAGSTLLTTTATRAAGANQRIRVAVIGCGGQGTGHANGWGMLKDAGIELAYVCDPDEKRVAAAAQKLPGAKPVTDMRTIFDDKSIDAVSIATPDHWHAPAALLALDAGKHVYVEKPCSHNFREGELLVAAAERTGKVVQHGTQMRSSDGFTDAIQMLRDGIIGDVLVAKAWNVQRRGDIGRSQPTNPPAGFDYDTWVGPAVMTPFRPNCHHYSWHWWYNFGTGDVGNDGVHEIDYARWGLGVDSQPTGIAVVGGKYFFDDDQQFPDTVTATFDFANNGKAGGRKQLIFEMRLWSQNHPYNVDGGTEFYGTKGMMMISRRGKFQLWEGKEKSDKLPAKSPEMNFHANQRAFIAAVRNEAAATADAKVAHLSASLVHFATIGA
ncbi:MAG: Gfo/Idh/MocA family oxidoreductase, partial [Planctomycetota bacterium]|nr:Gfo/Idh/MocA family oxidoreductase [Planctomycetota bacterium]